MELALIAGFCSVKWMRVLDFLWMEHNLLHISAQQKLVLIYLPQKDGKLS